MSLDLIPWEQLPEAAEESIFTAEWNGGSFTIPKYGFLEVNELNKVRQVDPSNVLYRVTSKAAVALSKALQKRANENEGAYAHTVMNPAQCFGFLSRLVARQMGAPITVNEQEQALQIDFWELISPFLEEAKEASDRVPIRGATVILQRIRPGWTDEQTQKLPPSLFSQIYRFYQDEESGGKQEDPEEQVRELEETLGKLRQEVKSTVTGLTGPVPSGNVADFGQEQENSPEKTSVSSPAPLSLLPSKRATQRNGKGYTGKS